MRLEGVRPEFLLYRPPESFNAIGITPERVPVPLSLESEPHLQVVMRYEAHEALRRETITMLRRKRQEVAGERLQEAATKKLPAIRDEEWDDVG